MATCIKFSSDAISFSSAIVNWILYLSAPGAVKFGVAPWLSNNVVSSTAVTTDSTALKPTLVVTVSVYFEIIFDWSSVKTKWLLA